MPRGSISKRTAAERAFALVAVITLISTVALHAGETKQSSGKTSQQKQSTTAETVNAQAYSAGQWKDSEQIYRTFCIYCHNSGIGPVILGREYPAQAVPIIVRNGVHTMPAFMPSEINDAELEALAKWINESAAPTAPQKDDKGEAK